MWLKTLTWGYIKMCSFIIVLTPPMKMFPSLLIFVFVFLTSVRAHDKWNENVQAKRFTDFTSNEEGRTKSSCYESGLKPH